MIYRTTSGPTFNATPECMAVQTSVFFYRFVCELRVIGKRISKEELLGIIVIYDLWKCLLDDEGTWFWLLWKSEFIDVSYVACSVVWDRQREFFWQNNLYYFHISFLRGESIPGIRNLFIFYHKIKLSP